MKHVYSASAMLALAALAQATPVPAINPDGIAMTVSSSGAIDRNNPFFKPLGNGRSCASCHQEADGWSITPRSVQARFLASRGTDPLFRPVDGANAPNAPVATLDQRRVAYSMLLTRGVIRIGMPIPAGAEFTLVRADDPYGFAGARELSLFRRPLPSTNLAFNAGVMWDNRETPQDAASGLCIADSRPLQCFADLQSNLLRQASGAVRGHAQASVELAAADQQAIVRFERGLHTAQLLSFTAGNLGGAGVSGGPERLAAQPFYFGINDVEAGDYRTRAPFRREAMGMFAAWRALPPTTAANRARAAIARGEQLFNTRPMNINGVAGFSDVLRRPLQSGTCSSCHDAPNAGTHSVTRAFNIGTTAALFRTPDMPLYTLRNTATGEVVETTDPGVAMVSGKWRDVGKFKTPGLRGLAGRAPYFHDGSARTVEDVVGFYDFRFKMGLSAQEAADLAAFLKAL
jgi:cytochrome c553